MTNLLARLDAYGTDEPGFNEGQPEDRCPVCDRPVADHRPTYSRSTPPARWPHRRAAAIALLGGWLDRKLVGK